MLRLFLIPLVFTFCSPSKGNKGSMTYTEMSGTHLCDTSWYEKNKIKEIICYENDIKNGNYFLFDKNGNITIEGKFENGKRTGVWKEYGCPTFRFYNPTSKTYENTQQGDPNEGCVTESYYKNDSIYQSVKMSFDNRNSIKLGESTIFYLKDTLQTDVRWYPNGNLASKSKTVNHIPVDTAWAWREDGTLYSQDIMKSDGTFVVTYIFDVAGKKVVKELYFDEVKKEMVERKR